ncbi:hypothetical protein EJB05_12650, partial [Eragrostis curvula]
MSAFAWACISEGLNPEPHAFYRVYQARHTPTYDHEQHLSPCFGVVGFEAREGFLTPLGSFDPPPFDEWVKDWFYYKYLAVDFYTGKASGIWITNDLEPSLNGLISQCVDAFRRASISGHLKTELLLFLGSSLRRSELKALEGASVFELIGSSTVEMDPSLAVVTPDVESIPRNTEIPSSPGSLLVPTYSLIFEEPSPDAPSNSAIPPAVLDIACESSSLIPSEGLQGSPAVASDAVCTDGVTKRSELINSCPLVPECSKDTFGLPKRSSFFGLLGKRKLSEVSGPSRDITSTSGTALPSTSVAVPPSQSSNPDASSLGSLELDVETMLSSINDDIQGSSALESAARKVRFPKVELGLSNLSGDVLFRSLVAHQIKSIILTRACAREFQDSSGDLLLASSLQASLSAKDDSLKASSAATSDLLAEVEVLRSHKSRVISDLSVLEEKIRERKASLEKEKLFNEHLLSRLSKASQLKISSVDNSFAKSLVLCDLVKELFQALGAKYDEVPADASLEVLGEWLRLNLAGLVEICRSFSYDAVILMIRDLLHSFSCEGSDAIDLVSRSDFSMKPSDPSHDFKAVEGKCMCLINDFWWNRVKCLVPDFPECSS